MFCAGRVLPISCGWASSCSAPKAIWPLRWTGRGHGEAFFLQGFVVIMSNPKMLVLFGALIPPFLSKDGNMMQQTLLLGVTFAVIAAVGDTCLCAAGGKGGHMAFTLAHPGH